MEYDVHSLPLWKWETNVAHLFHNIRLDTQQYHKVVYVYKNLPHYQIVLYFEENDDEMQI